MTTKFIQEKLNGAGPSIWTTNAGTDNAATWHSELSDVLASSSTCTFSFRARGTDFLHYTEAWIFKTSFGNIDKVIVAPIDDENNKALLSAAGGEPGLSARPDWFLRPADRPVFVLYLRMKNKIKVHKTLYLNNQKAKIKKRGGGLTGPESDEEYVAWVLYLTEEDVAQRVAKAIVHATELCGGTGDDGLFK